LLRFQSFCIAAFFLADQEDIEEDAFPTFFLSIDFLLNKDVLEPVILLMPLFSLDFKLDVLEVVLANLVDFLRLFLFLVALTLTFLAGAFIALEADLTVLAGDFIALEADLTVLAGDFIALEADLTVLDLVLTTPLPLISVPLERSLAVLSAVACFLARANAEAFFLLAVDFKFFLLAFEGLIPLAIVLFLF